VTETSDFFRDLIVVNKPSSIPVHPAGRYRHNSLVYILAREHNMRNLHLVHRIDRMTSGLLIMATSSRVASKFSQLIQSSMVKKTYLARVTGRFPDGEIVVDQPILTTIHAMGYNEVHPDGKPCQTIFRLRSYDAEGDSSLVECQPITGRTHQIRVHLKHLGHPITNDPLYGKEFRKKEVSINAKIAGARERAGIFTVEEARMKNAYFMENCPDCLVNWENPDLYRNDGDNPDFEGDGIDGYGGIMYLHAFIYRCDEKGLEFNFQSPLPSWALDGFTLGESKKKKNKPESEKNITGDDSESKKGEGKWQCLLQ
jgi:hypothetical protein